MVMVKTSGDALLTVINDILDFSKVEAGKLELDNTDFALRDTLDDALKLFGVRAHARGLELAYSVAADVPDHLVGDPARLRQVVLNLVGNALKFTDWGEVILRVAAESAEGSEVRLHFAVSDTGCGIPAEKRRLIFDPFTQADGSVTRRHGGTGLGLTISARLVELMGGRIWVDSEVGKGSTFHFTVAFGRVPHADSKVRRAFSYPLAGTRVLVVDDNATNRLILEAMLRGWSMVPVAVADGQTALVELEKAALAGAPYPLVLLDSLMPGMSGFDVATQIRARPYLVGVSVMMLTSEDVSGHARHCQELGVAAYLIKPIKQAELRRSIEDVLGAVGAAPAALASIGKAVPAAPAPRRSLRILLAEDNPINQQLAVSLLQKQGHSVTVASDGRQAVVAWESESFDVVLMDVQMPEMDGFEATAAIRGRERLTGRHTPIIAMTAHAMRGDEERCLQAGMDGYLAKPVRANDLIGALQSLVSSPEAADHATPAPAGKPFDRAAALAAAEGDQEVLCHMAQLFDKQAPVLCDQLRQAIREGCHATLRRVAHTLKGSLGSLGAEQAWSLAQALEQQGEKGDLAGCQELYQQLEDEVDRVQAVLAQIMGVAV